MVIEAIHLNPGTAFADQPSHPSTGSQKSPSPEYEKRNGVRGTAPPRPLLQRWGVAYLPYLGAKLRGKPGDLEY